MRVCDNANHYYCHVATLTALGGSNWDENIKAGIWELVSMICPFESFDYWGTILSQYWSQILKPLIFFIVLR